MASAEEAKKRGRGFVERAGAGISAARRALEVGGIEPGGHIVIKINETAVRIMQINYPVARRENYVCKINETAVRIIEICLKRQIVEREQELLEMRDNIILQAGKLQGNEEFDQIFAGMPELVHSILELHVFADESAKCRKRIRKCT